MRLPLLPPTLLLCLLALAGCWQDTATNTAPPKPVEHRFPLTVGGKTVQAQVAVTPEEKSLGLMYRKSLKPDEGMLFVYDSPKPQSYWMKNVPIPLDIGFFDAEGKLLEVRRMYANSLDSTASSSDQVQYALEMRKDWFADNQVRAGAATLDLGEVAEAVDARGRDAEAFNIGTAAGE